MSGVQDKRETLIHCLMIIKDYTRGFSVVYSNVVL